MTSRFALRRTFADLGRQFASYLTRFHIDYPSPCERCNPGDLLFEVSCFLHARLNELSLRSVWKLL